MQQGRKSVGELVKSLAQQEEANTHFVYNSMDEQIARSNKLIDYFMFTYDFLMMDSHTLINAKSVHRKYTTLIEKLKVVGHD